MMYDDGDLLPDLTPEENDEIERQFFYGLLLNASLWLKGRAEAMEDHAKVHKAVSKTIIETVVHGRRFIGQIWDARSQGTHGEPCAQIVYRRYPQAGKPRPADPSGLLPTVLTEEELRNANAAAEEFGVWLEQNQPVVPVAAIRAFQEIGQRYRSQDDQFAVVFPLAHARKCLQFLRGEIETWP